MALKRLQKKKKKIIKIAWRLKAKPPNPHGLRRLEVSLVDRLPVIRVNNTCLLRTLPKWNIFQPKKFLWVRLNPLLNKFLVARVIVSNYYFTLLFLRLGTLSTKDPFAGAQGY